MLFSLRPRTALVTVLLAFATLSTFAQAQPPERSQIVAGGRQPNATPRHNAAPPQSPITPEEVQTLTGGPTLITFSGKDVPLADVVKAFIKAAHLPENRETFVGKADTPKTLTVDWKQMPFWDAAAQVEKMTGLYWSNRPASGLGLTPAANSGVENLFAVLGGPGDLSGRVGAATPFVKFLSIKASRATTVSRALGATGDGDLKEKNEANQVWEVYYDPKLQVQSAWADNFVLHTDPIKTGPAVYSPANFDWVLQPENMIGKFYYTLPFDTQPGDKIPSLTGTLHTLLTTSTQMWKIPNIDAAPEFTETSGPLKYSLTNLGVQNNLLAIHVSMTGQRKNHAEWKETYLKQLKVVDSKGNLLGAAGMESHLTKPQQGLTTMESDVFLSLVGTDAKGPFSLELPLPGETKVLDTPFEFRDITVP